MTMKVIMGSIGRMTVFLLLITLITSYYTHRAHADNLSFYLPADENEVRLSQKYDNPTTDGHHTGIDLIPTQGKPDIYTTNYGKVVTIQPNDGTDHNMGNTIIIQHTLENGEFIYSLYAHLDSIQSDIKVGSWVSRGQIIGKMGATGKGKPNYWDVVHLHFEIKDKTVLHNPSGKGTHWGYVPGSADDYGYHNPYNYFDKIKVKVPVMIDLYFNKSNFTTGDTKDSIVTVTGGGYTVKTYVQMTKPDGAQRYAYYPNPNFNPTDPLYFSDTKRPLYDGTLDVHGSTWLWDRYQFTGSEPEGTWTWEFWYEHVNKPGIKLGHDSESYTFAKPSQRTTVTIGDLQYYEFAANRVSSSTAAINVIYFVYHGYRGYPEFRTGSNAHLPASEFGIAMRSSSETTYEDLDPTIIPGPISQEQWEAQGKPRCYVKNTGKSIFEVGDLFAFKTTDGQYIKAKITNLNSTAKEVTMEWEYYPGYHSQVHNETNFINQGQQIVTQFVLDPLIDWFMCFLDWPGSEIQLVLVKPDGSEITPDVAQTDLNIIHYYTPTSKCYTIATPDPGEWQARISAVDAVPGGEQYSLNVTAASDVLSYMLGFSPTYFIGDTVNIGTVLKENIGSRTYKPLLNINVTAQISRPDNSTHTLDLYDDGNHGDNFPSDGIYANVYTNLNIYGPYQIAVTAEGTTSNNLSFTREIGGSTKVGGIDAIGIDRASLTPPDGSKVRDARPTVSATIVGPSFNIDTSSILLTLDGEVVPHTFDTVNQIVSYTSSTDLTYGLRTATLDLKDSRGNSVPQASWSFTTPLNAFAYPNPCYPNKGQSLKIVTNVSATSDVKVQIYDLAANLVRVLEGETEIHTEEDSQVATWDCTNEKGERVARGIYIYLVTTSSDKKIGKIAIIK